MPSRKETDFDVAPRAAPLQTVEVSPAASNKARLILLTGADFGRMYRITSQVIIGRDQDAGIRLDVPDVSRMHSRLWHLPSGQWMVEDLDSRNGTQINGLPVEGKHTLTFGDRIQVGGTLLFVFTHYDHLEEQVLQLQKMDSVGQLASGVAHDLKNLLAAVVNNVDFIAEALIEPEPPKEDIFECITEMKEAITRTVKLTERLLGFSRPGKEEEHPTDVSAVIQEVVRLSRRSFPKDIEIDVSLQGGLLVMGDSNQLHQALMNLCINARDAMSGGGKLILDARTMRFDTVGLLDVPLSEPGDYVVVTVSDNGEGMDEDTRRRAFDHFFTTKEAKKGTGLGLAMVFAIVNNHGGRLQLESVKGEGTTFRIFLPTMDSTDDNQTTYRLPTVTSPEEAEGANTILVADDEEGIRVAMERLLRKLGYEVLLARDGQETLKLYEEHVRQIKLVILDVRMPHLGAEDLFNILKTFNPHVRVMVMSGSVKESEVRHLMTAGAKGFIAKPFETRTLQEGISAALDDKKSSVAGVIKNVSTPT